MVVMRGIAPRVRGVVLCFGLAGLLTCPDWPANNAAMTKDEAIKALGGTQAAMAEKLGMTQGSVSLWGEYPPAFRQIQIERLTGGQLKAEPWAWQGKAPKEAAA